MEVNYKNWIPRSFLATVFGSTLVSFIALALSVPSEKAKHRMLKRLFFPFALLAFAASALFFSWCVVAYRAFSYKGKRQLSRRITEGTADYVTLPPGGVGLDVGCGSGALTIACAKRNPQGRMLGVDAWGGTHSDFSQALCENNAQGAGVDNVSFQKGNAVKLDFPDETFDLVTSNYVYHNINGVNKQDLLRETLRVLKKGGHFVLHDIMSESRYGDMDAFVHALKAEGYAEVELIDTTDGLFMNPREATVLMLKGSKILRGIK